MRRATAAGFLILGLAASPVGAQPEPVETALDAALDAPDDERLARQQEVAILGVSAVPRLIDVLGDGESAPARRAVAAWALGEIADPAGCDALAGTAHGDAPGFNVALDTARARCGDLSSLRSRLDDDDPILRARAALTLALLDDGDSSEQITALRDDEAMASYRLFITLATGLLGDEFATPLLEELLREQATRPLAAIALARLGDDSMIFELQFAYQSDDPIIREAVVRAVVALRPPGAEDFLAQAASDPLPRIADYAARELRLYPHRR